MENKFKDPSMYKNRLYKGVALFIFDAQELHHLLDAELHHCSQMN